MPGKKAKKKAGAAKKAIAATTTSTATTSTSKTSGIPVLKTNQHLQYSGEAKDLAELPQVVVHPKKPKQAPPATSTSEDDEVLQATERVLAQHKVAQVATESLLRQANEDHHAAVQQVEKEKQAAEGEKAKLEQMAAARQAAQQEAQKMR